MAGVFVWTGSALEFFPRLWNAASLLFTSAVNMGEKHALLLTPEEAIKLCEDCDTGQ